MAAEELPAAIAIPDAAFADFVGHCEDTDPPWRIARDDEDGVVRLRPDPRTPNLAIQVRLKVDDVPAEVVFDSLLDPDYRATDEDVEEFHYAEVLSPRDVVLYSKTRPVFVFSPREACYHLAWRRDRKAGVWKTFFKSINHPLLYHVPGGCVRNTIFEAGWLLKRTGETACSCTFYMVGVSGGSVPRFFLEYLDSRFAGSLQRHTVARTRRYPEWKREQRPNWKPWLGQGQFDM